MWLFRKNGKKESKPKINGVTLGWDLKPHLSFSNGTYYPGEAEKLLFPEYFKSGEDWPRNPKTGEKLEIAD